tara:strand:+ start:329 stop:598 length:270 start_codon:yes stop_codon:yes gene_type:complete
MTDLKIEKNVPLHSPRTGKRGTKYPHLHELLKKMEVGDSIVFPLDNPKQRVQENKEACAFYIIAGTKYNYKMAQRKSGADCNVRFWRLA